MKDLKSLIKKVVEETLDEMTSTGNVAGYATPFAFRKGGKNKATSYIEKLGYRVCKDDASNNDGDSLEDGVLLEDVQYDASKDVNAFRKSLSAAEVGLSQKFSDSLKQKLLGKNIEIQGSKGYGQFKTKYALRVLDVSVEDWYGKEDYQLIITGEDRKQYFVDVTVPIKVVDSPDKSATKATAKPAAQKPGTAQSPTTPVPQVQPQPTSLDKAISK
jgi:hypothetical protein